MTADTALSSAVVELIGKGRSAIPAESWDRVADRTPAVRRALEAVMRDYRRHAQLDWAAVDNDLLRGRDVFVAQMGERHPELDPEALAALGWKFSWDWR